MDEPEPPPPPDDPRPGEGDPVDEVRATGDERQAGDWALVLAAEGIEHRLDEREGRFLLVVHAVDGAAARQALDEYDEEARAEQARRLADRPPPAEYGRTFAGFAVAAGLLVFHLVVAANDRWLEAGEAASSQILRGEAWRTVTALTLHADWMHAFGNAAACAIFVTAVMRWLGPGFGAWLLLVAGAVGNGVTALVHGRGFYSVGASTAVFAAVGILCGLQFVTRRRVAATRARAWIAIGASLALLAMLGVGAHSDVLAHLFGLVAGTLLGVAAGWIDPHPRRGPAQIALALAALAAVAGCWWLALR